MSVTGDTSRPGRPRPVYRDANLHIIFGVTLMAVMGVASVTPAFPTIVKQFGITPQEVGWLITAFTLPGVILTAVLGLLSDQFGRKTILVPALLLFAVAGTACAFARDFRLLLGLRFLQGAGAAGLGAMNLTILGDLYRGRQLNEAMGCNSSVLSVGTASYPAIGGALATLGWFYPFLLPLAALPVALAVLFSLDNPEPSRPPDFQAYLRQVWAVMASRRVVGLFTVSVLTFVVLYGPYMTYFPLWLADTFAVAPFTVGLVMSISSLATAVTAAQAGRLAAAFSERSLIGASCLLYGVALVAIPLMPNLWLLSIPVAILGVAQGMNMPSLMTLLAGECDMEQRGALMSVNGMVLRLGQTLGPLVMGWLFVASGYGGVFLGGVGCAMLMLAAVLVVMR